MLGQSIGLLFGFMAFSAAQTGLGPIQPPKGQPINEIPMVGMGSWALFNRNTGIEAMVRAIEKGFRHFDTAAIYRNEDRVGAGLAEGLKRTGLKREDIWVTTKIWNNRFEASHLVIDLVNS
jgi:alcohol dehydrogenase (NADP+)